MSRLTKRVRCDVSPMILKLLNIEEAPEECIEIVGTDSKTCDEVCEENQCQSCVLSAVFEKLAHYEDLEEQGRLIELPCERVYCIVDTSNPKSALIMSKRTSELRVYEIERIDKDGYYWSTKEEAEARLNELKGEQHDT